MFLVRDNSFHSCSKVSQEHKSGPGRKREGYGETSDVCKNYMPSNCSGRTGVLDGKSSYIATSISLSKTIYKIYYII